MSQLPVELWPLDPRAGWGNVGICLALGLARLGRTVVIPPSDLSALPATVRPTLEAMMVPRDESEQRVSLRPYGMHWPKFIDLPNRTQVLIYMAEQSNLPDHAVEEIKKYPLVLAPSRWAQGILSKYGIGSTHWLQPYNESVFFPAPRQRPADGPLFVFLGGKLEFRKGMDCSIEAFRRFRGTPEGKDAVLVTAINNIFPQTMVSIWESGFVRGVPVTRDGTQDIPAWLEANDIPRSANIDLGLCTQIEMAAAIRECDFAIFPNRCECATNLVLPEVLGCGVPAIVGNWAGQADVCEAVPCLTLDHPAPVTLPCPLFDGYEGWGEPNIDELLTMMQDIANWRPHRREVEGGWRAAEAQSHFGSRRSARTIHDILTQELDA